MIKLVSTTDCNWYKGEENGVFMLINLTARQRVESVRSSESHLLFTNGVEIELLHENGEKVVIPPFHLYHVRRNNNYTIVSDAATEVLILTFWRIEYICSKNTIIKKLADCQLMDKEPCPICLKPPMCNFIDSMKYYLQESLCCAHLQELKRRELSILFKNLYSVEEVASILVELLANSTSFKGQVMQYVSTAKTVNELARLCGYSLKTFERLFREHYDMTPYKWMSGYKLERLKEMIADNEMPIKLIVSTLGFTSASHLNTFCKKHLGVTPSVLRFNINNEADCFTDTQVKDPQ